jgi:hypothetical protein
MPTEDVSQYFIDPKDYWIHAVGTFAALSSVAPCPHDLTR